MTQVRESSLEEMSVYGLNGRAGDTLRFYSTVYRGRILNPLLGDL